MAASIKLYQELQDNSKQEKEKACTEKSTSHCTQAKIMLEIVFC